MGEFGGESRNNDPVVLITHRIPEIRKIGRARAGLIRLRGKRASSGERWLPEFGDTHECWRGSHPAVTRSLLMGLTALGHTVQFNPQAVLAREVRVGCLASPQAAAHLLRLREA